MRVAGSNSVLLFGLISLICQRFTIFTLRMLQVLHQQRRLVADASLKKTRSVKFQHQPNSSISNNNQEVFILAPAPQTVIILVSFEQSHSFPSISVAANPACLADG